MFDRDGSMPNDNDRVFLDDYQMNEDKAGKSVFRGVSGACVYLLDERDFDEFRQRYKYYKEMRWLNQRYVNNAELYSTTSSEFKELARVQQERHLQEMHLQYLERLERFVADKAIEFQVSEGSKELSDEELILPISFLATVRPGMQVLVFHPSYEIYFETIRDDHCLPNQKLSICLRNWREELR